jgi:hypothetical protein
MTKLCPRTPLVSLVIAAAWSALPRAAAADEPQWVPVIVDQASSEQTMTLVNAIATVLRTKENVVVLDPAVAARKFEAVHSAAPVEVPEDELRALGDSFRRALEAAAIGQWDKAYEIVRRFDELSQPVQDYVTWRLNLSRDIFDYCLMSVHFMLAAGREAAAREEMRSCIYSAPHRTLSPKEIPEHVIQIHESVKTELLAQGAASLDVDASGAPASTTGCVAVVNGAPKGALPYRETGLLPVPVRIQVNCQRPGRIHVVHLAPGRNSLIVDLRFERVVSTEDYLGLRYADAREEQASQVRDALTLAKTLGGTDLLLVRKLPDGRLSVRRYGTQLEQLVSEVTLAMKANADEIRVAAHALATSRSGVIAATDDSPTDSRGANRGRDRDAFARIMVAVGSVSSFAIAWGTYAEAMRFRGKVAADDGCAATARQGADVLCVQSFARYQTLGDVTLIVGALGSALGVAASPAALPDANGIPVWSWIAGVAGAGITTAGALLWSGGTSCSLDKCEDGTDPKLGQLLVLHGPPLLAIPITHGIRALLASDDVEARASYLPSGAELTVGGRF